MAPPVAPDNPGDHGKGASGAGGATEATLLSVLADTTVIAGAVHDEDDPAVNGDPGVLALAVRNDTDQSLTDTDLDYSAIAVDEFGRVKVVAGAAAPVQRLHDGDIQVGVGTITIPDGVLSYAVTVLEGGSNVNDLSDWVTIDGPDFAAATPLRSGQSIGHSADASNTIAGPLTVTVPALGAANATWVLP